MNLSFFLPHVLSTVRAEVGVQGSAVIANLNPMQASTEYAPIAVVTVDSIMRIIR